MRIQYDTVNPVIPFRNVENAMQCGLRLLRNILQERNQSLAFYAACKLIDFLTVCGWTNRVPRVPEVPYEGFHHEVEVSPEGDETAVFVHESLRWRQQSKTETTHLRPPSVNRGYHGLAAAQD